MNTLNLSIDIRGWSMSLVMKWVLSSQSYFSFLVIKQNEILEINLKISQIDQRFEKQKGFYVHHMVVA